MRTIARETLFKIIFTTQFGEDVEPAFKHGMYKQAKLDADDIKYCDRVLSLLSEHMGEFVSLINERSRSFPEKRIFPADKSILLVALTEILYMDDIPRKVSLNEAANIASKYSSEKSASFITGILSSVGSGKDVQAD